MKNFTCSLFVYSFSWGRGTKNILLIKEKLSAEKFQDIFTVFILLSKFWDLVISNFKLKKEAK